MYAKTRIHKKTVVNSNEYYWKNDYHSNEIRPRDDCTQNQNSTVHCHFETWVD